MEEKFKDADDKLKSAENKLEEIAGSPDVNFNEQLTLTNALLCVKSVIKEEKSMLNVSLLKNMEESLASQYYNSDAKNETKEKLLDIIELLNEARKSMQVVIRKDAEGGVRVRIV